MFNKLEARVLSEYKRSRAAPSTFCTLIKHYFSFIKHYITVIEYFQDQKNNFVDLLWHREANRPSIFLHVVQEEQCGVMYMFTCGLRIVRRDRSITRGGWTRINDASDNQ